MAAKHSALTINGTTFDLSHLDGFTFACPTDFRPAPLTIGVRFSNHCYTVKCDDDAYTGPKLLLDQHRARRLFDAVRHALSLHLPAMVQGLPAAKVWQTYEERNYMHFSTTIGAAEYRMFFHLRRAPSGSGRDLDLFVESAYPLDAASPSTRGRGQVRFKVLAAKVYKGEAVRFDQGRNAGMRKGRR